MSKRIELNCDVLVVGAGPAGIAACVAAAESGARVILIDDNPLPGGQIWRASTENPGNLKSQESEAASWLRRLQACGATLLLSTRVVARLGDKLVLAENESGSIEIAFRRAILATGARELLLPFPGWTLPNVFAPGGLQALVKSGLPVKGKRVVIAGTGPLLLAVAAFLKSKGARIEGVYDQAPWRRIMPFAAALFKRPSLLVSALVYRTSIASSPLRYGWWPVSASGEVALRSVTLTNGNQTKTIACDMLACGFHLIPNTELQSAFGCRLVDGKASVDEGQRTSVNGVFSVGESAGVGGLDLALVEGQIAGFTAAGKDANAKPLFPRRNALRKIAAAMERTFAPRAELRHLVGEDTIVCRCEDVSWVSLRQYHSMRHARIYSRCGMGSCQGRICGAALKFLTGWESGATRPPIYPVQVSTLIREPQTSLKEKP
jgi:NADPH-dependent 2,4-dienoyl-CoA reductase/sulfur reductase-like enzyme